MFGLKATRHAAGVGAEGELEGLDIHEHGAPAYHPEYAYMGYSQLPPGKPASGGAYGTSAPGVPAMSESSTE